MSKEIAIIGGGIIGLAIAYKLLLKGNKVVVLEKEAKVGSHQSSHNSGVLHAGLYYKPGSLKAQLARSGIQQMIAFCEKHAIRYDQCGKLVVATDKQEEEKLLFLFDNGKKNGLKGLRLLSPEEMLRIEPHVRGVRAIHVPEEGIADYEAVCYKLQDLIKELGGTIRLNFRVDKVIQDKEATKLATTDGQSINIDYIINSAGLYSDKVAMIFGFQLNLRIIPFRGEYYKLKKDAAYLVKHLIYPVPNTNYPFLGVHFTRMISGSIEAGPNAVLAFRREGYKITDFNLAEFIDALSFKGLRKFILQHKSMVWQELCSSISKTCFLQRLQKLIPAIKKEHLTKGLAGVRAQAVDENGAFIQDFAIIKNDYSLHLINAPSPGATASLAIADHVINQIGE